MYSNNCSSHSIYRVNEESSDTDLKFKLELTWVGKDTKGKHLFAEKHLYEEAKQAGSAAMEQGDSDVE